jgi:NADH:ubiquinone oxidoreductase subunit 6 (subunit J)
VAVPAKSERRGQWWIDMKSDLKWAVALLFVLTLALAAYVGWARWNAKPRAEENLPVITSLIFAQNGLVVPFEILSVLLLAALIAGVVIAFRDPEVD